MPGARAYTASFTAQTVAQASGDYELVELDPADDKAIELYAFVLGATSELGDAAEEILNLNVIRGHTTDGTGGASFTPKPLNLGDTAAGFTADTLRTAIASAGTSEVLMGDTMNVRAGYSWGPMPEGYGFVCREADGLLVVRLTAAVTDDVTMTGTFWVRELV